MDKIRVVLPRKYDLVVGDTFQLFYRGVVEAPNPFCYDILAVCEKGKNFPRYFEYCPEEEGEHILTISVYDADKKFLGQGKTILKVVKAEKPKVPVNILCVGDSLTTGGQWPKEAHRRLKEKGGEPTGLGFENVSFVGSCQKDETGYEGYGGWRWDNYLSTETAAVWIGCDVDKTEKDQHSIWKDENNNLWKLETIDDFGFIKFLKYGENTTNVPQGDYLYHHENAINQEPIFIKSKEKENTSPFYDAQKDKIDFLSYSKRIGVDKIDAVYVLLGYNGLHTTSTLKEFCKNIVSDAKKVVDMIYSAMPDVKVKIIGVAVPSVTGGMGANYGAVLPYCDDYGLTKFVMDLNIAYEEWAQEEKYKDFVEFINLSGQFDTDNSMPAEEKPVNVRSKKTEIVGTNGLHPTQEGYMQIADAAFRNMVHFCKSINDR